MVTTSSFCRRFFIVILLTAVSIGCTEQRQNKLGSVSQNKSGSATAQNVGGAMVGGLPVKGWVLKPGHVYDSQIHFGKGSVEETVAQLWLQTVLKRFAVQKGGSFFSIDEREGRRLVEIKAQAIFVGSAPLDSVDKLNGVEWRGQVALRADGVRYSQEDGTWTPWKTDELQHSIVLSFEKTKGEWTVQIAKDSKTDVLSKPRQ